MCLALGLVTYHPAYHPPPSLISPSSPFPQEAGAIRQRSHWLSTSSIFQASQPCPLFSSIVPQVDEQLKQTKRQGEKRLPPVRGTSGDSGRNTSSIAERAEDRGQEVTKEVKEKFLYGTFHFSLCLFSSCSCYSLCLALSRSLSFCSLRCAYSL